MPDYSAKTGEVIMLLESYRLEIFNSECNPGAMTVMCYAHLDQDVGEALPYLNTELGGFEYVREPPAVTFRSQGKLITVHNRKIAVNALKDEIEARKIVEWLKREINHAWEHRREIEPSYQGVPRPKVMDVNCLMFPGFRNLLKIGAYDATEYQQAIGAPMDMILKPENESTDDGVPRFAQLKKSIYGRILKDDELL
jgi:hypothetical protein